MKITIDIPDVKFDEFNARDLLERIKVIPTEYKNHWTENLIEINGEYTLTIAGIEDGEIVYHEYSKSVDEMNNLFLDSISHFEYDGSYGTQMEITSDETPSFSDYRREGSLKDFLEEVVSSSIKNSFEYGYVE